MTSPPTIFSFFVVACFAKYWATQTFFLLSLGPLRTFYLLIMFEHASALQAGWADFNVHIEAALWNRHHNLF